MERNCWSCGKPVFLETCHREGCDSAPVIELKKPKAVLASCGGQNLKARGLGKTGEEFCETAVYGRDHERARRAPTS